MAVIASDLQALAVPVEGLCLLPGNPRRGDIGAVAASLAKFGQRKPIVVRRSDGTVVAGNHTLQAAQELGWAEIAVVWVDDDDATAKAFALADNRTSDLGDYDERALADLIAEIQSADAGLLSATGYTDDDLANLLAGLGDGPGPGDADEDDVPPAPDDPQTRRDDVWILGPHRLLCGDSTLEKDVGRLLAGARPALMVTDPPYGVGYDPEWRQEAAEKGLIGFAPSAMGTVTNDDRSDWSAAWALSPSDVVYCWHGSMVAGAVQAQLEAVGFEIRNQIVWAKSSFAISRGHYNWQHETCWYGVRKGATAGWLGDHAQTTLWEVPHVKNETGHGTQKPVECMARPLRNHAGDVYDPFAGSGTTLIAAHQHRRTAYLMEIAPAYCDVICRRYQEFTGTKPVLEATGEPMDFSADG